MRTRRHFNAGGRLAVPQHRHAVVVGGSLTGLAIGYAVDPGVLPENLRVRDLAQRARRPLAEVVFGGQWGPHQTSRNRMGVRPRPGRGAARG